MLRRLEVFYSNRAAHDLVQLFAPIAAFRMVAYAANDPLYMAPICSGNGVLPGGADEPRPRHSMITRVAAGFARSAFGGAVAIDTPPLIFVSLHRAI